VGLPATTELLLKWDSQRPRSQQAEMGMSKLGSCRRQAGYHLQGYPADEGFTGNKIQAVIGTAIHQAAAEAARELVGRAVHAPDGSQGDYGGPAPQVMIEDIEVRFGGLTGHPDIYLDGVLRDIKTVGYSMQLEQRRRDGPPQRERYQVHTYGAGLILQGYPVHTVQLDYIARDSGEEFLFEEPFDVAVVEEAMAWLDDVRHSEIITLSRDFRPDSATCQQCPYFQRCWEAPRGTDDRTVLFRDDPNAARWALQLWEAGLDRKRAKRREDDAKGALDHLRSVSRPGEKEDIAVPGLDDDDVIRFTVKRGRQSPDMAKIAVDYKNAGARPPMRYGEPTIGVALIKRPKDEK